MSTVATMKVVIDRLIVDCSSAAKCTNVHWRWFSSFDTLSIGFLFASLTRSTVLTTDIVFLQDSSGLDESTSRWPETRLDNAPWPNHALVMGHRS